MNDQPVPVEQTKGLKKRYLAGAGAAACAVCCAAPILTILGIAGTGLAATAATMVFAGVAFGLTVLIGTGIALLLHRRRNNTGCDTEPSDGPVTVQLLPNPSTQPTSSGGLTTPDTSTQGSRRAGAVTAQLQSHKR